MLGLTWDDLDDASVDIFPDNIHASDVFVAMATQWRQGGAGPTGLDYAAIPFVARALRVPRAKWPDTFDCLRTMEHEALRVIHGKST